MRRNCLSVMDKRLINSSEFHKSNDHMSTSYVSLFRRNSEGLLRIFQLETIINRTEFISQNDLLNISFFTCFHVMINPFDCIYLSTYELYLRSYTIDTSNRNCHNSKAIPLVNGDCIDNPWQILYMRTTTEGFWRSRPLPFSSKG